VKRFNTRIKNIDIKFVITDKNTIVMDYQGIMGNVVFIITDSTSEYIRDNIKDVYSDCVILEL
jgi:hypothetical protein